MGILFEIWQKEILNLIHLYQQVIEMLRSVQKYSPSGCLNILNDLGMCLWMFTSMDIPPCFSNFAMIRIVMSLPSEAMVWLCRRHVAWEPLCKRVNSIYIYPQIDGCVAPAGT